MLDGLLYWIFHDLTKLLVYASVKRNYLSVKNLKWI